MFSPTSANVNDSVGVFFRLWELLSTEYVELDTQLLWIDKKPFIGKTLQLICMNESIPMLQNVQKC